MFLLLLHHLFLLYNINGVEVEGTSKIIVSMNSDGDVEEIYSSYREIEEVVAVKENYTIDEMSAELENLNGKIYINDDADVHVDDITLREKPWDSGSAWDFSKKRTTTKPPKRFYLFQTVRRFPFHGRSWRIGKPNSPDWIFRRSFTRCNSG